jgi:hypothetical protein
MQKRKFTIQQELLDVVKYKEDLIAGSPYIIGSIYINRWAICDANTGDVPAIITVTIDE